MDTDYAGTLSTLTKFGTLNVSATRVPRKKRSRGNIAPARTRCIALTPCVCYDANGNVIDADFRPTRSTSKTRKPNRVVVVHDTKTDYETRVRRFGAVGNID